MSFSLECQALLQSLERATSRLAGLNPEDFEQVERAMRERRQAIEDIANWVAREHVSPVSPELAMQLKIDLDHGADVLVRLALARAATLRDLKSISRELQLLHSLSGPAGFEHTAIDCQG
jgi:hypothetical protein